MKSSLGIKQMFEISGRGLLTVFIQYLILVTLSVEKNKLLFFVLALTVLHFICTKSPTNVLTTWMQFEEITQREMLSLVGNVHVPLQAYTFFFFFRGVEGPIYILLGRNENLML